MVEDRLIVSVYDEEAIYGYMKTELFGIGCIQVEKKYIKT